MRFLAILWFGMSALAYGLVHFPLITVSILAGLLAAMVLYNIALEIKYQIEKSQPKEDMTDDQA